MRFWLSIFLVSLLSSTNAQVASSSRKAQKLYEQAGEAIKNRDFDLGLELYHKAVKKDPGFAEAYYKMAVAYTLLGLTDSAYTYYSHFTNCWDTTRLSADNFANLAEIFFVNGNYAKAKECKDLAMRRDLDLGNFEYNLLAESIEFAIREQKNKTSYKVVELPVTVNRFATQYFPTVTIDGRKIFFTKREGFTIHHDEDIVMSTYENGTWTQAVSISANINTRNNEGASTISADGRMLIFTSCEEGSTFGSCDLFISSKEGDKWSKPMNMGSAINSRYWDSQPSLSADGRTLYFSSNRPGGFGQRDIWVSYRSSGVWSKPVNLGTTINTRGDETTPYIHVNGETLFFASTGLVGFGGYDIFITEKQDTLWSEPKNLGYGLNDHHHQFSIVITPDGRFGYYAMEKMGEYATPYSKLVTFEFESDTLLSSHSNYVTGTVRDAETRKPIAASIELYNLENNKATYVTISDPVSGTYFFALNEGNAYGVYANATGYLFEDFSFEVSDNDIGDPDTLDIYLTPVKLGASMILENIYFEFDSYQLNERSKSELDMISRFLSNNKVRVVIEGHTDSQGSDEYNLKLSAQRAKAVYDYLILNGIASNRLAYRGKGDKEPIHLDEDMFHKNRRIEFKVVEILTN